VSRDARDGSSLCTNSGFRLDWARVMQYNTRMTSSQVYDRFAVADAGQSLTTKPDMALREFTDWLGRDWLVWEVEPFAVERHVIDARRLGATTAPRDGDSGTSRMKRTLELTAGWLVFESASERRRLYPYPRQWATLCDADLRELAHRASPTQHARHALD